MVPLLLPPPPPFSTVRSNFTRKVAGARPYINPHPEKSHIRFDSEGKSDVHRDRVRPPAPCPGPNRRWRSSGVRNLTLPCLPFFLLCCCPATTESNSKKETKARLGTWHHHLASGKGRFCVPKNLSPSLAFGSLTH
ncbi:hypothetical protein NL676_025779 [Syzygium grande]|nr:hypothetical protein NL676_025779 [Syzygium grande]